MKEQEYFLTSQFEDKRFGGDGEGDRTERRRKKGLTRRECLDSIQRGRRIIPKIGIATFLATGRRKRRTRRIGQRRKSK